MSYVVYGIGSKTITAEGYGDGSFSNCHRKVVVKASVSTKHVLTYTITSSTDTPADAPNTHVKFYVNDKLVHDSGYCSDYSKYPVNKNMSFAGTCKVPSTGHPKIKVVVGICKKDGSQASKSGTVTRATTTYYTVEFSDGYSDTILKSQDVASGKSATPPSDPVRNGYIFTGWSGSYTNVTSDKTIEATWMEREAQNIYVESDVVYARSFNIEKSLDAVEIDGNGNIYASAFTKSDGLGVYKGVLYAKDFINGLPA